MLDREEYVEQSYFFEAIGIRILDQVPLQDILQQVREEILSTTNLPLAIDFLLAELKAKLPALESITVDYDWHGWVCLTRDFLPHIYHAVDDATAHYAMGYQGSGVAMSLHAGKLLARRIAGASEADPIPPFASPLQRFPLHGLARVAQAGVYQWYRMRDRLG